ncbi:unnamed protein product [Closterium sp. NIES-54]
MYAVTITDEGDCYRCFPPDPGIETAALGAGEAAALGASEAAALGASASASSGTGESALSGTASASASRTFTLDSGASRSFFRDRTTLTLLGRPVAVSVADPSGGLVLSHFSTVLPCPAAPSGTLSGLYLPSFSTNLVSGADLQDAGVHQFTPASQRVTHCTDARTGRHLATFTRWPGSSLYTLTTASPPITASGQVAASGQVFAAASRSGLESAPCSCRLLSHETLLWHHRLGHPSLLRLQSMASRVLLVSSSGGASARTFLFCVCTLTEAESSSLAFCEPTVVHEASARPSRFRTLHRKMGFAERRIGMVMDVARTSMMHAAAPHFLWPFAVRYAAHQINLQPRVSMPETSPALLWTGKVGDAFAFRGPAPSGVSQVDAVEPVEVAGDSGAAEGATPGGAGPEGTTTRCAEPGGAESGGAEPGGPTPGGAEPRGATPGGAEPGGAEPKATGPAGAVPGGSPGASSRREPLSPQELREWFARRWKQAAGAGGAAGTGGSVAAEGAGATGPEGARTRSTGAAGPAGTPGARAAAGVGAEAPAVSPGGGPAEGTTGATGGTGAGAASGAGASTAGAGAVPAVSGVAARPQPYFVPLLQQVLGLPSSTGPPPPLECPQPVPSQLQLQPASPLPAPSPYTGPTGGLAERREPASRPASPFRAAHTSGHGSRQRPPPVPGTHQMSLRTSTAPLRAPFPSPHESSLPAPTDPESDSLRAASPTVTRLLATVVTDPSFESTAVSALVAELVDFAAHCRLDYAASLVAESESVCPPSVGGECALGTDVLEDRQEEFQCLIAASPQLLSVLLTPEGDPDALDIPTLRSYAKAIEGPYSSQWQAAMDAEMASWKSTGTYVDEVPPPGANIVSGMWIFRVKRPPGSPPVFKARYVARGFSQRQGVDYFQTFSPTPKMTTLRVLLHIAAQRDYELHSLDFSTAFLQGSLHEEIWLRRPLGFTRTFPPGTQWSLRWPVYGLRQALREWHDTLRTTLAALLFADPSLFLRIDTSLPPFYILVYVDDLVFATADTAGLAHVKYELQKRYTCTDLGELRSYLGLQITRDRAQCTITLTQSHMVQQVLQRFGFTYSSPQATNKQ